MNPLDWLLAVLLLLVRSPLPAAEALVVDKPEGPVTATEIEAFKNYMRSVPVPANKPTQRDGLRWRGSGRGGPGPHGRDHR